MLEITFLGTGSGSTIGTKRAKSSIMISSSKTRIILDMGNGSNSRIEDLGFPDVDAVFFTHLHIDHFNGIFDYLVQREIKKMKPIKIFSPKGFQRIFDKYREVGNEIEAEITEDDLPKAKIGDLEVYSVHACHKIYAVSYVISDGRNKIIYSGDTKEPCEDIIRESKDANLIIHEATCVEGCEIYGHTTVTQVYDLFGKDKHVIITHIPAQIEDKIASKSKNMIIAYDGMRINV
ncbi:MBL fold metallo-hydrolase [Acidianus sulfidivorans JP7]|uniref:MBL fold metallo-hydrolase n=1 Tax=Acidianus sulfidivorans JP7 TaxID=619593 RepID=A0A2U9INC5_9CREN|nr:MBL fold metallo-hydrolase [Acidianus sulfidivorans]AWR97502.1 MBL fold metallo-hydrolase [Acidianus sulfidivorans JP7]